MNQLHADMLVLKKHKDQDKTDFRFVPLSAAVCYMAFTKDSQLLAVVNKERLKVELRDPSAEGKGSMLSILDFGVMDCGDGWSVSGVSALSFSDGLLAVTGGGDVHTKVQLFEVPDASEFETVADRANAIKPAAESHGYPNDGEINLRGSAAAVALRPDGQQVAIGEQTGHVWVQVRASSHRIHR